MSIGAQRVMTLRTKKGKRTSAVESTSTGRQSQRVTMPHNSVFVLGAQTNMEWLHGVRADKRPSQQKSDEEKSFGGERISLTFRHIATFTDQSNRKIWGQGARQKTQSRAGRVRSGDDAEMEAMITAFGRENHQTEFDWQAEYGKGFDVIDLVTRRKPRLHLCLNKVANLRIQLSMLERKISYEIEEKTAQPESAGGRRNPRHRSKAWSHGLSNIEKPILHDADEEASEIEGDLAILFYLDKHYPYEGTDESRPQDPASSGSQNFSRAAQSNELLFSWQNLRTQSQKSESSTSSNRPTSSHGMAIADFEKDLVAWEVYAKESQHFITGKDWTMIDCAFWPVLNEIVHHWGGFKVQRYPALSAYHERVLGRESVQQLLEDE
ncbi:MAG: hypothetical protein Q9183_003002 [Haloplaca sp. 2 TL-2023]